MKNVVNIKEEVRFNPDFMPIILYMSKKAKVPLICLDNGQEIPPHPSAMGLFYCIEGEGTFIRGTEEIELKPGIMIIAEDGIERGMKSKNRLVVLAVHVA
jgi:quercetin dioxygenase-like cupin family protein